MVQNESSDTSYHRVSVPIITTTIGQFFSGPFVAIKADIQENPNLTIRAAFRNRFISQNNKKKIIKGFVNIYRGNFWNYTYTLGCSLMGNNLAEISRRATGHYASGFWSQSIISGFTAGLSESIWTTSLVARELSKTTSTKFPGFVLSYKRIFISLALRDSLGWCAVQAGALHIQRKEKTQSTSSIYKISTFAVSGVIGAIISTPADANLRRVYSDQKSRPPGKIFIETTKQFGLFKTLMAGLKPRIAVVSPPYIAYGFAQYFLDKKLSRYKNEDLKNRKVYSNASSNYK